MKFKLLEIVRAASDVPDFSIKAGDTGTVVEVYDDGEYEVEFCGPNGETLAIFPMKESQLLPGGHYSHPESSQLPANS